PLVYLLNQCRDGRVGRLEQQGCMNLLQTIDDDTKNNHILNTGKLIKLGLNRVRVQGVAFGGDDAVLKAPQEEETTATVLPSEVARAQEAVGRQIGRFCANESG